MNLFMVYEKKGDVLKETDLSSALEGAQDLQNIVWCNLLAPAKEELEIIGKRLGIHELTLEDIENLGQLVQTRKLLGDWGR